MPKIVWNPKSVQVKIPFWSKKPEFLKKSLLSALEQLEAKQAADFFIVYTKEEFERNLLFIGRRRTHNRKSEWKLSDKAISVIFNSRDKANIFVRTGRLEDILISDEVYQRVANCLVCNNEPHCNGPCTRAFMSSDNITIRNDNVSIVPLNPVIHCGQSYSCGRNMLSQNSSDLAKKTRLRANMS